jgi:hypothetical protein
LKIAAFNLQDGGKRLVIFEWIFEAVTV